MTVLTRKSERILQQLVELAGGNALLVREALRELHSESREVISVELLAKRILELRAREMRTPAGASA